MQKASEKQIGGNHYKRFKIQPTEFIEKSGLSFCEGNIIKYVCRHSFKNGKQDLEKAKHYCELLMEYSSEEKAGIDQLTKGQVLIHECRVFCEENEIPELECGIINRVCAFHYMRDFDLLRLAISFINKIISENYGK